jgi:hypothetical protein
MRIIVVNTLGLTGAELLSAELARFRLRVSHFRTNWLRV